ncbi:hypothetical protein [Streptomyces fractus]|uniref:hypothetical protein n=1 Tax=Streptomyces fractus TaxID=641806 RepID=UPI003CEF4684
MTLAPTTISWVDLRRRLRAGEREAFAELYEQWAATVQQHELWPTGGRSWSRPPRSSHGYSPAADAEGNPALTSRHRPPATSLDRDTLAALERRRYRDSFAVLGPQAGGEANLWL